MTELLTLQQTRKLDRSMPVLMYGSDYWKEVINFEAMLRHGVISHEDMNLIRFVDGPSEALDVLQKSLIPNGDQSTPSIAASRVRGR